MHIVVFLTDVMQIIVGGAQEEMSLQYLMQDVESEISNFDLTSLADGSVSQTQVVQAVFDKLRRRGQLPNCWRNYFYYYI